MLKKKGEFKIVIRIRSLYGMETFIEKKIVPLKEKYPYANIRIEVLER